MANFKEEAIRAIKGREIDEYRYLTKEQFKLIRNFVYSDFLKSEKQEKEKADNKKKEISNLENEIKNYKITL